MNISKIAQKMLGGVPTSSGNGTIKRMTGALSTATQDFVCRLHNSSPDAILTFLHNEAQVVRLRSSENKIFKYKNMLLTVTDGNSAYNIEQNLTNPVVEGIAPHFVDYLKLGENKFLSVMEFDTDIITPLNEVTTNISDKVKKQFKAKLIDMLNSGFVNKEIFANKEALFVTKDGEKIVTGDWTEVLAVPPQEREQFMNYIKRMTL